MPTRRPKVPKAGSAPDGSGTGGRAAGRSEARPAGRRTTADPDTISASKPVGTKRADSTPIAAAKPAARAKTAASSGPEAAPAADTKPTAAAGRLRRRSKILSEGSAARPAAEEASDDLRPVPAKAFSGRLLVLAMVTAVVTVLLVPSVNTYLHQRSDIAALEAEISAQEESSLTLESQLQRWEDPNYIKQQARERIFLVMPGETRYLVKGEHGVETVEQEAQEQVEDLQWVDSLWDSVKRSANAP